MALPILYSLRTIYSTEYAVFSIPTRDGGDVFMKIDRTNYNNDNRYVVVVDAEKFVELWKAEPSGIHAQLAHGSHATWPKDYKFSDAEDGFSKGAENPIPLADVSCEIYKKNTPIYKPYCVFLKRIVGYHP